MSSFSFNYTFTFTCINMNFIYNWFAFVRLFDQWILCQFDKTYYLQVVNMNESQKSSFIHNTRIREDTKGELSLFNVQPVLDHTFWRVIFSSVTISNNTLYKWCLLGVSFEKIIPWRNYVTSCALLLGDANHFFINRPKWQGIENKWSNFYEKNDNA